MFQTKTSRVIAALLAAPLFFSVQGCTDDEVIGTIAGAAIVGGAVAIASNNGGHHHDDCCRRGRGRWDEAGYTISGLNVANDANATDALNQTSEMASHYGVTFAAAAQMQNAMNATVQTHSLQPLLALGVSRADMDNFAQMQPLSSASVNALSQKLEISDAQVTQMVSLMQKDIAAQQANQAAK